MEFTSLSNSELYQLIDPYTSTEIRRTELAYLEILSRDKLCYPAAISLGVIYRRSDDLPGVSN